MATVVHLGHVEHHCSTLNWFLSTLVVPLALNLPMASQFGSD